MFGIDFHTVDRLRLLDIMEQFELICAAPRDNEKTQPTCSGIQGDGERCVYLVVNIA